MLEIANLEANYFLASAAAERTSIQRRLDRLVKQRLADELASRFDLPAFQADGVYRIRVLRVDLWLDALQADEGSSAEHWARAVAQAIGRALLGGDSTDVVRFDDHAHFVAAFLVDRLRGAPWSWCYDELRPLEGVSVGRAAALLLAARPELILPVARRLSAARGLESLVGKCDESDVDLIWERGLGARRTPRIDPLPEAPGALRSLGLETGGGAARARNLLRLFFALTLDVGVERSVAAPLASMLALLHTLASGRVQHTAWQRLLNGETAAADVDALLEPLASCSADDGDWLRRMASTAAGRARLAALASSVAPDASSQQTRRRTDAGVLLPTPFAGLALLLPAIRDLALFEKLGRFAVYQVLIAAAGRQRQPQAIADRALARLAGVADDERESAIAAALDWPALDELDGNDGAATETDASMEYFAAVPAAPMALRVLRRFAAGLRGMAASSPRYLARQFLNGDGAVLLKPRQVEVRLRRVPLHVLLRMAGAVGDLGPMACLGGRRLVLHLEET